MAYNGKGNALKENEVALNMMGNWAESEHSPTPQPYTPMTMQANLSYEQYLSPRRYIQQPFTGDTLHPSYSARNQQTQAQTPTTFTPQQAQVNTQQHARPIVYPASSNRSYAAVAAQGPGQRRRPNETTPNQPPAHQQQAAARPIQQAAHASPRQVPSYQRQFQWGQSYAQVAATGQQQTAPSSHFHRDATSLPSFDYPTAVQQNYRMDQLPYNDPNSDQFSGTSFGNLQAIAAANDDWMLDPNTDFELFDRFLNDPEPYVPAETLNVDTSRSLPPTQLLMSPTDSIDASSTTSSMRRSKQEIMNGNSGPNKCQHCGAGFTNKDDRRHHEHRVHLPYSSRPWPCPHCNYRAVLKKDLGRHLPKHGDRAAHAQYFCSVRGCKFAIQGFVRKDHYNRHMEIHRRADSAIQMSRSTSARTSY